MSPLSPKDAIKAIQINSRFPLVHGAPVHIGFPEQIGVKLNNPDFGNIVTVREGEIPVFWGCGVIPQLVAMLSGLECVITHSLGRMFLRDLYVNDFSAMQLCFLKKSKKLVEIEETEEH